MIVALAEQVMQIGKHYASVKIAMIAADIEMRFVAITQEYLLCPLCLPLTVRQFLENKALASIPISCME
jgi:hypothetical protein